MLQRVLKPATARLLSQVLVRIFLHTAVIDILDEITLVQNRILEAKFPNFIRSE